MKQVRLIKNLVFIIKMTSLCSHSFQSEATKDCNYSFDIDSPQKSLKKMSHHDLSSSRFDQLLKSVEQLHETQRRSDGSELLNPRRSFRRLHSSEKD